MPHDLINLTAWPSMPAPWSSADPGEAWVWGDFVATFQTKPILVAEMLAKMAGEKGLGESPLEYLFAMTVFYRKDRNPHGPSSQPVLVATLERMDYEAAAIMMGVDDPGRLGADGSGSAPVVQGLFTSESRFNLGQFPGEPTRDSARKYFLDLVGRRLSLTGEPVKIGSMADIHGHPNTGWPAQEQRAQEKKSAGCLGVIAAALAIGVPVVAWVVAWASCP